MASYPALVIANYFLRKAEQAEKTMSPMKLIKLVYFAHGWYLALQQEPLLEENVYAWRYGPVIEPIYHQFKKFGNDSITESAPVSVRSAEELENDEVAKAILDKVWEVYSPYSAVQLSNATHESDTPWYQVWETEKGRHQQNCPIDNCLIEKYFSKLKSKKN